MAAQKQYELVYIASPDATEEQLTELQSLVDGIVTKANGTVDKTDVWGRRRLAYQIARAKPRRDDETRRRRVARGLPPEPTPEELMAKQAALDNQDDAEV